LGGNEAKLLERRARERGELREMPMRLPACGKRAAAAANDDEDEVKEVD
jgi:hypothetical protein